MSARHVFRILHGPDAGEVFEVGDERSIVGRAPSCRVALADGQASREHCALEVRDGRLWVIDLASKNGTRANGIPVEERTLSPGDRLTVGRTILEYRGRTDGPLGELSFVPGEGSRTSSIALDEEPAAEILRLIERTCSLAARARSSAEHLGEVLDLLVTGTAATAAGALRIDPTTGRTIETILRPEGERVAFPDDLRRAILDDGDVASAGSDDRLTHLAAPIRSGPIVVGLLGLVGDDRLRPLAGGLAIVGHLLGATLSGLARIETLERERSVDDRHDLVGTSPQMVEIVRSIERVAASSATVLVRGESGTGKELVARAIHRHSARAGGPFVAVNSAAIPIDLVESELFGHERGAFTGAVRSRTGRFADADGGTLFLDEIGDLHPAVQAKLLRVLEDGTFHRVGGHEDRQSDARIVAATHQDLEAAIAEGTFREDLYYRLRVIEVVLPPLRDRPGDVDVLADHFLTRLAGSMGRPDPSLTPAARELLARHRWPGNVRELKSAIERALILSPTGTIDARHLAFLGEATGAEWPTLREVEEDHIERILSHVDGNKSAAARILGIDRKTLYHRLRQIEHGASD